MLVWLILSGLMTNLLVESARPDPPSTTTRLGSKRYDSAEDCIGVVAFSATSGSINNARLVFTETLVNKGVGYASDTGIFTTHCPGLYQFSFAGYGSNDLTLILKKKINNSNNWINIVSAGPGGGANQILIDSEAGEQFAVFINTGKATDGTTFSGYRISKK